MRFRALALALAALMVAGTAGQSTPSFDKGASGAWQKILKLKTTASVMHTTAHPDDEHGGALAVWSRRDGARVSLATLTRGEAGDNAIGPQLFDALGLIRTEELREAGRYYGLDAQYFTTVIDYGFSKRLEEAFDKWGRDNVLRDLVRLIRMERPWVVVSRFQGNARDGHGNHQTAGLLTQMAFDAAGDPARFPEQLAQGLRPWQPFKLYIGGMRENEDWTVTVDTGEYSPWLGDSYDNVARTGLAFQRSQNSGRMTPGAGANVGYYRLVKARESAPSPSTGSRERSIFDGLDTSYAGLFTALGRPVPPGAAARLANIDRAVARAMGAFSMTNPSAAVPALADGLGLVRDAIATLQGEAEALFVLGIKERQFEDAIAASLGLEVTAVAAMPPPVAGQAFDLSVRVANRGRTGIEVRDIALEGEPGWSATPANASTGGALGANGVVTHPFSVRVADDAKPSTKPYFMRSGLAESRYTLLDPTQFGRPTSALPLQAVVRVRVAGVDVTVRAAAMRRESRAPYGEALLELRSVPRLAITVTPQTAVVPLAASIKRVELEVSLVHNAGERTAGQVALRLPGGWTSEPAGQAFEFERAGERATYRFTVTPSALEARAYQIEAVATARGLEYREGYEVIEQRDLQTRYLYRPSMANVRGIDVATVARLRVGYVMGIGDTVPEGLRQLGAEVTLLGEDDLARGDLSGFDTIMTGTRAYAVRDDLKTYNRRLLDYVRDGGNLVVLYNTQELDPKAFAPFPGELLRSAEEVSEEDSPVTILAPSQQSFTWPNKITLADFDGWVEQRGSKFFSAWDAAYTPMISTFDKDQAPQSGGWLTATYGKGHWTYFAYALHRQLPYGVPGAYRLAANLLALGKKP